MKKWLILMSLLFAAAVFFYVVKYGGATTGRGEPLWPWQVASYQKSAKAGDGDAQYMLSRHYWALYDDENADYWYTQCVMQEVPACLLEKIDQTVGAASSHDFGSDGRAKFLDEAEGLLKKVQSKPRSDDSKLNADIEDLDMVIKRLRTEPSYKL